MGVRLIELLPNGFVRVDCRSGLVRLWQRDDSDSRGVSLRSGQGRVSQAEVDAVTRLVGVR